MRALSFDGKVLSEIRTSKPRRGKGEALIRVSMAGICSTDLEILGGYMDFRGIPGHEFTGTVEKASSSRLVGRRVTGEINIPCLSCELCKGGLSKHCPGREVLGISGRGGAFAEYLVLPERNLHTVPPNISDEEAVFTELLAAACEIPARVRIAKGARVAVLGDGRLASMAAQVLALKGAQVTVAGKNRKKLEMFASLGIEAVEMPQEGYPGRPFDVVVECTGSHSGPDAACSMVRPRGTVVLKSTFRGRGSWNPTAVVLDELKVTGSRCGPFRPALALLRSGDVKVLPFLSGVYPFSKWKTAFRESRRTDNFKIAITFDAP